MSKLATPTYRSQPKERATASVISGSSCNMLSLLPRDIVDRIAQCLEPNEVAATFRLLDPSIATTLGHPYYVTIRLSQCVPHHAFVARWTRDTLQTVSHAQRAHLLNLTAGSNSVKNLAYLGTLGCIPTPDAFVQAASSGALETLEWLKSRYPSTASGPSSRRALLAAAKSGHRKSCEWLLSNGCDWHKGAARAAARAGHEDLFLWLAGLEDNKLVGRFEHFLASKAYMDDLAHGCSLEVLKRTHHALAARGLTPHTHSTLAVAAASPTPDWQAKVLWLEEQGCAKSPKACEYAAACTLPAALPSKSSPRPGPYPTTTTTTTTAAAATTAAGITSSPSSPLASPSSTPRHKPTPAPTTTTSRAPAAAATAATPPAASPAPSPALPPDNSALARLQWLRGRSYPVNKKAATRAACNGNSDALRYLLTECGMRPGTTPARYAAKGGHLDALKTLDEYGIPIDGPDAAQHAAEGGHLPVVVWLVERKGRGVLTEGVFTAAVKSGRMELLAWLLGAQCPRSPEGFRLAVREGKGEVVDWMCRTRWPLGVSVGRAGKVLGRVRWG